MIINIEIKNRIANYVQGENTPVCGNSEDSVRFVFDAEWGEYPKKTARFFWGNQYHEEEFEGDTCKAPMFLGTKRVLIGVYAGESADGEPCIASTKAEVTYLLSARCTGSEPSPGTGENYTNEAKGAAIQATEAAELAAAAADRAEAAGGLKEYGSLTYNLNNGSFRFEGGIETYEIFNDGMLSDYIQPIQYKCKKTDAEGNVTKNIDRTLATGLVALFQNCRFVKMTVHGRAKAFVESVIHEEWIMDATKTTKYTDSNISDENKFYWSSIIASTAEAPQGNTKLIHTKYYYNEADQYISNASTDEEGYALWLSEGVCESTRVYSMAVSGTEQMKVTFTGYN